MITGGQNYVSSSPVFSNDAKKLLVCTGNTVSVFSTTTGFLITELEGHDERVTAVVVVPVSGPASRIMSFCWTSSIDGTICYWDFASPELLKKLKVGLPIFSMVIPNVDKSLAQNDAKTGKVVAVLSVEDTSISACQQKALRGKIHLFSLTNSRYVVGGLLAETREPQAIAISNSGEFIGIRNKRKLHVWRIPSNEKYEEIRKVKLYHTKDLSALAFHPTERIVAGGDVTGRILIWRDFGKRMFSENVQRTGKLQQKPGDRGDDVADSCSTWHWHPSEVKFLSFSSDGAYLYSGGKEGVLVVWQLDTGTKNFKPRLGSPILFFTNSSDPCLSCISCADNQIYLLKMPSMEIMKSISGIKFPFSLPDIYKPQFCRLAYDSNSGAVVLPTENYCLQFFSLLHNREISQVQVCKRNYQPIDDVTVFVLLLTLSVDGSMMGTVDVKLPEEGIGGIVTLKFWTQGSKSGQYLLSTIIYEPHSEAAISSLAFRPGHGMAVTSSLGGDFKVWVVKPQQKEGIFEKSGWKCQSVGSYKRKPMTAAAFSKDGSVLAVAADAVITLWDPDKNLLVAVLGDTAMRICSLSFIGRSEYVASITQGSMPRLAVWSLATLSLYWSYNLFVEDIASSGDGSHFAVLALSSGCRGAKNEGQGGVILLFDVEDSVPLATWSVKRAKGGSLCFISSNASANDSESLDAKDSTLLAYVNGDREFMVFNPLGKGDEKNELHVGQRYHVSHEETERYGYAAIYGELPEFDLKKQQVPEVPFVPSERPWETIFSGSSSHAFPPLTGICSAFLESLLERRPAAAQ